MALELIRKNGYVGVTPYLDAMVYYVALGNGIFSDVLNGFTGTYSGGVLTLKSGMGIALGYQFRNPSDLTLAVSSAPFVAGITLTVNANDESLDTAIISSRPGASIDISDSGIVLNGSGAAFIPLWACDSAGHVTTINGIVPGRATQAQNLLAGGKINGVDFSAIFNTFKNNANPGAKWADNALTSDLSTHLGSPADSNAIDGNFKLAGGGYMPQTIRLFNRASIDLTPGVSTVVIYDVSIPAGYYPVHLWFIGATGSVLADFFQTFPSGTAYLDNANGEFSVISVAIDSAKMTFTVATTDGVLFRKDEYRTISAYLEIAKANI